MADMTTPNSRALAEQDAAHTAIRDALRLLCVDQDHRGAFDRLCPLGGRMSACLECAAPIGDGPQAGAPTDREER